MSIDGKHTPAPWGIMAVAVNDDMTPVVVIGPMERPDGLVGISNTICMVPVQNDQARPNVSMICASPVMFGTLKMLRRSGGLSDTMNEHIDAVLAMATAGIEELG